MCVFIYLFILSVGSGLFVNGAPGSLSLWLMQRFKVNAAAAAAAAACSDFDRVPVAFVSWLSAEALQPTLTSYLMAGILKH